MARESEAPFPQADNFNKIIKILMCEKVESLEDKGYVTNLIGVSTERQAYYYLSAAEYLGLVSNGGLLTADALHIRTLPSEERKIILALMIVKLPVFGDVFMGELIRGITYSIDDIVAVMKKNVFLNSEAVYRRRAQTVRAWLDWIAAPEKKEDAIDGLLFDEDIELFI